MDLHKPVSGRQFAKMVGQSESAVRKAAVNHSILEGKTPDGKYIPFVAAREWGKAILQEFAGGTVVSRPAKLVGAKKAPRVASEKPEPVTADDFVKEMMDEPIEEISAEEAAAEPDTPISDGMTKVEAERKIAVYKARMAELAYQEKRGDMIPRVKLRVLFEYGSQIRASMESMSDRCIDEILANAEDRQVAKRKLDEEIHNTLNSLADPERLNL